MESVVRRIKMNVRSLLHKKCSTLLYKLSIIVVVFFTLIYVKEWWFAEAPRKSGHTAVVYDDEGKEYTYNSETSPLIFIGGHPRSGTTLMRAMLDAHTKVRCGEESRIVPRIVQMRESWMKNKVESNRLVQGGIDDHVINAAVSSFVLETIANHGEPAEVLCNKDPLTLKSGTYMSSLFPNSKWLFMMRDGRAVIHSVITRKVTISGYKMNDPKQCLGRWNTVVTNMEKECNAIGPQRCMVVYYEQLVLHPRRWMTMILDFLDIPFEEGVLHHEDQINKPHGIRVSMVERSSDQIIKPVNIDALKSWVGFYSQDVLNEMDKVAPALQKFGYDPFLNVPNYGVPDSEVLNNTNLVHANAIEWEKKSKELIAQMNKREEELVEGKDKKK